MNTSPTGSVDELRDAIKSVVTGNTSTAHDDQDDSFTAIDDYSGLINDLEQLILAREEAARFEELANVFALMEEDIALWTDVGEFPMRLSERLAQLQSTQSNMKENK